MVLEKEQVRIVRQKIMHGSVACCMKMNRVVILL